MTPGDISHNIQSAVESASSPSSQVVPNSATGFGFSGENGEKTLKLLAVLL